MTLGQAGLIAPRDLLVAVSFVSSAPDSLEVVRGAHERSVPVLVFADAPLSPLLPLATAAFEIEDAELHEFRALSATMCLALTLIVRLGQRLGEGQTRSSKHRRRGADAPQAA
jgi:DNA-binding MurR/RpiR family transcriptional regulator